MRIAFALALMGFLYGSHAIPQYSKIDYSLDYLPVGEWRLNESREAILRLKSLPNLKPVKITGGLETSEGNINGKRKNISFVFNDNDCLDYAQVWLYEGKSRADAIDEFYKLYELFGKHLGGAFIKDFNDNSKFSKQDLKILTSTLAERFEKTMGEGDVAFMLTLDLIPTKQAINNRLHGSFTYSSAHKTYWVFLFEDRPGNPSRISEAIITLSKANHHQAPTEGRTPGKR